MIAAIWNLVLLSFRDPRGVARHILSLPLGENGRWAGFALMVVTSALMMHLLSSVTPLVGPEGEMMEPPGPFFWAMTVGVGMSILTGLAFGVGRMFGGRARASDMAVLVAWLQLVQLVLAAAQLVVMLILPVFANVLELVSLLVFLWLLTAFVAEAHGFRSNLAVAGGVAVVFVVMVLVLTVLLFPYMPAGV